MRPHLPTIALLRRSNPTINDDLLAAEEDRLARRERADRLADELSGALAARGTNAGYIDLLEDTRAADRANAARQPLAPLSWFKRFFH